MGAEKTNGAAVAVAEKPESTAPAGEFSREVMENVFKRHGQKLPAAVKDAKVAVAADGETAEAKATREAAEADALENETAEQKAEREAAELEARETETPEAKATREATQATSDETAKVVNAKLKDLPEPQRKIVQSIIDTAIARVSGRSKAEVERLGNRVVELTTELETARKNDGAPVVVPGLHPALLADTADQIDRYADELAAQEDMLDQYRDSGIEADEAKGQPAFTADQVRTRIREIKRERERILPQARTNLTKRTETETGLKTTYAAMFDPRTDDYRIADTLRRQLPELRRLPNAAEFVAKFVLGTKALAELQKPASERKAPLNGSPAAAKKVITKPPVIRKAPRAPGDGSAAHGSPLDDPRGQAPDAAGAVKSYTENRSRAGLLKAVGSLVFRGN